MVAVSDEQIILVVEDSDDDFFATSRAFKKIGLTRPVQRCTNGDQALDFLYHRGAYAALDASPRPIVVLLDLNLPGTDGRDVLKQIKADPALRRIPVIVLSTSAAEGDVQRCYDAGANSFVQKPMDNREFMAFMASFRDYWFNVSTLPEGGTS